MKKIVKFLTLATVFTSSVAASNLNLYDISDRAATKIPTHEASAVGTGSVTPVRGKEVLSLGSALTMTSGGIVALDKTLTIELTATGWTLFDIVALQDLDIFVRSSAPGTPRVSFIVSNLILADKAKSVRVWKTADVGSTAFTIPLAKKDARGDQDLITLVSRDLPAIAPTKVWQGETYTLNKQFIME